MAKFTPGPWAARLDQRELYVVGPHDGIGCPTICDIPKPSVETVAEYAREREGNARLIAAAPDLLELVLRAIRVLRSHLPPDGITETEAISQLLGIFDGPEQRAAFEKAGIPNGTP